MLCICQIHQNIFFYGVRREWLGMEGGRMQVEKILDQSDGLA